MGDTPKELQAEVNDLTRESASLNSRLSAVEAKMGRIKQSPSIGDRFKAAFLPKKSSPLAKLTDEREAILQTLRANKEQMDAAKNKLDVLAKANEPPKEKQSAARKVSVGDSLKQSKGNANEVGRSQSGASIVRDRDPSQPHPGSEGYAPQLDPEPSAVRQQSPSRSNQEPDPYATSLGSGSSGVRREDPSRSGLASDPYATFLGPETPTKKQTDPLRSELDSSAYASSLQREPSKVRVEDPLRSELEPDAYGVEQVHSMPSVSQKKDVLRSELEPDAYDVVQERSGPSVSQKKDVLRSELEPDAYDVVQEKSVPSVSQKKDVLRSELEPDSYDVVQERSGPSVSQEKDALRSEPEPDAYGVEQVQSFSSVSNKGVGPKQPEGVPNPKETASSKFKMKPLEERYVEGEKFSSSKKVQIGGKEVEVHEKEWMLQQANEDRRKQNLPEISQEEWNRRGLQSKQATTQYFNDEQRAEHGVSMESGMLEVGGEKLKEGRHVFVMDGEGQVFAKKVSETVNQVDDQGRLAHVHHSSFLAGEEVAGAGEFTMGKDGALKEVSDRSGHYHPGEDQTKQTLEEIDQRGVSLDNVKFAMDRGDAGKTRGMTREYLQGQVTPEEQQHRAQQQDSGKELRDVSKVMEQTFKGRHNVADEIRGKGESVRDALHKTDNLKNLEKRSEEQGKKHGLGKVK